MGTIEYENQKGFIDKKKCIFVPNSASFYRIITNILIVMSSIFLVIIREM